MSKELVSQRMVMTCEACGATKEWELVGADSNPEILQEMQLWYVVAHKVVSHDGQLVQMTGDACSLECVPAVAVKLALPAPTDERPLDLASLRVSNLN